MTIKVYLHETTNEMCSEIDSSICFYSREFGWMEYFDEADAYHPLTYKNKIGMIGNSYVPSDKAVEMFKKYGKLTYLGVL